MEKDFRKPIIDTIEEPAKKAAEFLGLMLLRINVRGAQHNPVIEVILDGPRYVSIEDCAHVSRELHTFLEGNKNVSENFRLDVLSPGLEEPIVHDWQLQKNLGKLIEIHHQVGEEKAMLHGRLSEYTSEMVGLAPANVKGQRNSNKKAVVADSAEEEQTYEPIVTEVLVPRKEIVLMTILPDFSSK